MRILLDEGVNPRLRLAFPGDEVKTVPEIGWRSLTNGELMKEAAPHFDVFVTFGPEPTISESNREAVVGDRCSGHPIQRPCGVSAAVCGNSRRG